MKFLNVLTYTGLILLLVLLILDLFFDCYWAAVLANLSLGNL